MKQLKVYLWILSFLKPYKGYFLLFILFALIVSAIDMSIPKFIQYFIDDVLPARDYEQFGILLLILAALFVISIILAAARKRVERILQEKPAMDVLRAMLEQLRYLGLSYYEKNAAGSTLSLFKEEVNQLQHIYRRYFPSLIHQGIMLLISTSLLVQTNAYLSLIIIPCFLSYYLVGPYFEKKATIWARESQSRRTQANQQLYNSFSAFLELRAFGAQKWDTQRLIEQFTFMQRANNIQNWFAYSRGTVRRVTIGLGALAMFWFGIGMVQSGELTVGAFIAFSLLYTRVIRLLTSMVTLTTEQRLTIIQTEKLYLFMKEQAEVKQPTDPIKLHEVKGELSFHNVTFAYPGRDPIIEQFNLEVTSGMKVALVGKSGNGKSTLTKLIGRFYDPQDGEIYLDGIALRQFDLTNLRDHVGFVFQEAFLYGDTVRANIAFACDDPTEEQIVEAAKAAYAHDFIMELPQGYDTVVGERGIKLSGGQKQRIAIARLFLRKPKVLVLDEATSALDNVSEYEVKKALEALMENCTTITVAHRLSTVQDYDQIVVVDQGRNAEQGTYEELIARGGLFYQLLKGESEHE